MSESKTNYTYILVLEIDPMEVGRHYKPVRHCTILGWFNSDIKYKDLAKQLTPILYNYKAFTITAGKRTFLTDTEVNVVKTDDNIMNLHKNLCDFIEHINGTLLEPKFNRDGYIPHVSLQPNGTLAEARSSEVSSIYLIECIGDLKTGDKLVRAKLELK